jgi:hypothetical protein
MKYYDIGIEGYLHAFKQAKANGSLRSIPIPWHSFSGTERIRLSRFDIAAKACEKLSILDEWSVRCKTSSSSSLGYSSLTF